MKLIKAKDTYQHANAENCVATEYDFNDKDIDFATANILGDYPESAWCVNEKCKEVVYILTGGGTLKVKDATINFKKGDAILIDKNEKYCWRNCNCKIAMCCSPAWSPEQHKVIDF